MCSGLDTKDAEKFHKALALYIDHGRNVGRTGIVTSLRRTRMNDEVDPNSRAGLGRVQRHRGQGPRSPLRSDVVEQYRTAMT